MPKKKKSALKKPAEGVVRLPEAMAHTFKRELELPQESIQKFRDVLAEGLPVKIALEVKSKIFSPLFKAQKAAAEGTLDDGDIIIDLGDLNPPDPGDPIPDGDVPPEAVEAMAAARADTPGWHLVGAKVEVYAVAVFRPRYANGP